MKYKKYFLRGLFDEKCLLFDNIRFGVRNTDGSMTSWSNTSDQSSSVQDGTWSVTAGAAVGKAQNLQRRASFHNPLSGKRIPMSRKHHIL